MDQQENVQKAVSDSVVKFLSSKEITAKDFAELPEIKVGLIHQITKNNFDMCSIMIPLHDMLNVKLPIKMVRFNVLRLKMGLPLKDNSGRERLEYHVSCKYRYIKGENSVGEYWSVELIFKQFLYQTYFFQSSDEKTILEDLQTSGELKIDWFVRPDKVDVSETINYDWQEI